MPYTVPFDTEVYIVSYYCSSVLSDHCIVQYILLLFSNDCATHNPLWSQLLPFH